MCKLKKLQKLAIIVIILILLIICLLIISLTLISNYMKNVSTGHLYYDRGIEIVPEADYIIVPGAQIASNYPGTILMHRLDYAHMLYEEKKAPKIIVSGGFDNSVNKYEPVVMSNYLQELGIPADDIILDLEGNSTYDTLKRAKEFVGDKSVIFCTQKMYSYRAVYIAKHLNLNINIFCSDPMIYAHGLKKSIRECLAKVKAVLNCTLFPPATSLQNYNFIMEVNEIEKENNLM